MNFQNFNEEFEAKTKKYFLKGGKKYHFDVLFARQLSKMIKLLNILNNFIK